MRLGRSDLQVSKLGIGTLQWGDPGSGFGSTFGEAEIASAFDELIAGGINFFDTAEVYFQMQCKPKLNRLEIWSSVVVTMRLPIYRHYKHFDAGLWLSEH